MRFFSRQVDLILKRCPKYLKDRVLPPDRSSFVVYFVRLNDRKLASLSRLLLPLRDASAPLPIANKFFFNILFVCLFILQFCKNPER